MILRPGDGPEGGCKMLRICNATEKEVWNMINFRMKSREDCWKAMNFLRAHDFPNIDDDDSAKFDSWMHALSWRANNEFR